MLTECANYYVYSKVKEIFTSINKSLGKLKLAILKSMKN